MKVTFIAPAYQEVHDIYMFLGSLLCQTNPNWEVMVYCNGPNEAIRDAIRALNDPRVSYYQSDENTGYWGCYNRIDALGKVTTPWVVQTSVQDYWLPCAVNDILSAQDADLIYWDSLHHYFAYERLFSQLQPGSIDWGNFAISTDLARRVGINHPQEFMADGLFIKDAMETSPRVSKISKILTIHN